MVPDSGNVNFDTAMAEISGLSLPFSLDRDEIAKLARFIEIFVSWNERFRFSKFRGIPDLVRSLVVPSLLITTAFKNSGPIIDLGSGPGIPGVPISIHFPDRHVTLVESSGKAVEFVRECKNRLDFQNLVIVQERAENIARDLKYREKFSTLTARAFAPLPILLEIASAFVKHGGEIVYQCSEDSERKYSEKLCNAGLLGLEPVGFETIGDGTSPVYYGRFVKTGLLPDIYPRSWKKMKNQPLF